MKSLNAFKDIRHRASGTLGVRFFTAWPLTLLKFSAGIPRRALKVTESDFPKTASEDSDEVFKGMPETPGPPQARRPCIPPPAP